MTRLPHLALSALLPAVVAMAFAPFFNTPIAICAGAGLAALILAGTGLWQRKALAGGGLGGLLLPSFARLSSVALAFFAGLSVTPVRHLAPAILTMTLVMVAGGAIDAIILARSLSGGARHA